jgi:hypothetical protein
MVNKCEAVGGMGAGRGSPSCRKVYVKKLLIINFLHPLAVFSHLDQNIYLRNLLLNTFNIFLPLM